MRTVPDRGVEAVREDGLLSILRASGLSLVRRDDGYCDIIDRDGGQVAVMNWNVGRTRHNERGGEIGSPYPLTLE
jgi:hypothetical protein